MKVYCFMNSRAFVTLEGWTCWYKWCPLQPSLRFSFTLMILSCDVGLGKTDMTLVKSDFIQMTGPWIPFWQTDYFHEWQYRCNKIFFKTVKFTDEWGYFIEFQFVVNSLWWKSHVFKRPMTCCINPVCIISFKSSCWLLLGRCSYCSGLKCKTWYLNNARSQCFLKSSMHHSHSYFCWFTDCRFSFWEHCFFRPCSGISYCFHFLSFTVAAISGIFEYSCTFFSSIASAFSGIWRYSFTFLFFFSACSGLL